MLSKRNYPWLPSDAIPHPITKYQTLLLRAMCLVRWLGPEFMVCCNTTNPDQFCLIHIPTVLEGNEHDD